jgi:hypothetical protein
MMSLDASSREFCVVNRSRTNTPLQALMLMNETGFIEAARAAAERTLAEDGLTESERIDRAFRSATARHPSPQERKQIATALARYRSHFARDPEAAASLQKVGEYRSSRGLETIEMAAWTMVFSLILNLDEVIVRE